MMNRIMLQRKFVQHKSLKKLSSPILLSSLSSLSSEWEEVKRRDGQIVYYNSRTKETVSKKPNNFVSISKDLINDSHKDIIPIDFDKASKIEGHESQIVQIELKPNQRLRAETGSMIYMTDGIDIETSTAGGIGQGFKRLMTGENFFVSDFTYSGSDKGNVAFGTNYPSKIVRIPLHEYGGSLICQKGAFLCGSSTIDIEMEFTKRLGVGFFGGEGFVLQRLQGDGDAFIKAGGTLIERELAPGEVLRISSGCLVAFENSVDYDISTMKGFKNVMFGGEGLFITTLTGPGKVFLQGLPFDRTVDAIARRIPGGGGSIFMPVGLGGSSSSENADGGEGEANESNNMETSGEASDNSSIYGASNDDSNDNGNSFSSSSVNNEEVWDQNTGTNDNNAKEEVWGAETGTNNSSSDSIDDGDEGVISQTIKVFKDFFGSDD